jgi:hypothetical protein
MRARVTNGKWVLEDPTDLPEGTVIEIVTRPVMPTATSANLHVDEKVREYIRALVVAGGSSNVERDAADITEGATTVARGANRGYVTPADVKRAAADVLRRFVRGARVDDAIQALLDQTPVP